MNISRRCTWLVPAAGAVGLSLTVACSRDEPTPVLVVGDSITALVADDLVTRGAGDFDYTLRATNGATSTAMLEDVREVAGIGFVQVILNVGTNDAMDEVPIAETKASIAEMLSSLESAECIHLTTLNEHVLSFDDPETDDRMREINIHLRDLADRDDRIDLVDWNAAIEDYMDRGEPDGPILVDTVHPTPLGQDLLVDLYVEAFKRCD